SPSSTRVSRIGSAEVGAEMQEPRAGLPAISEAAAYASVLSPSGVDESIVPFFVFWFGHKEEMSKGDGLTCRPLSTEEWRSPLRARRLQLARSAYYVDHLATHFPEPC